MFKLLIFSRFGSMSQREKTYRNILLNYNIRRGGAHCLNGYESVLYCVCEK